MAKKKTAKPKKTTNTERRKQERSNPKPGKGIVEIGKFSIKATWEVSGESDGYRVKRLKSEHGGKGTRMNARLRIEFGPVQGSKREALASILRQRAADKHARFTVVLNGVKHESLYLHELAVIEDDPIPCGLVFSDIAP